MGDIECLAHPLSRINLGAKQHRRTTLAGKIVVVCEIGIIMTEKQKQQALTLEFYPFETGSPTARFVYRMANYARYAPDIELVNEDVKYLERLFQTYIADMRVARQS